MDLWGKACCGLANKGMEIAHGVKYTEDVACIKQGVANTLDDNAGTKRSCASLSRSHAPTSTLVVPSHV